LQKREFGRSKKGAGGRNNREKQKRGRERPTPKSDQTRKRGERASGHPGASYNDDISCRTRCQCARNGRKSVHKDWPASRKKESPWSGSGTSERKIRQGTHPPQEAQKYTREHGRKKTSPNSAAYATGSVNSQVGQEGNKPKTAEGRSEREILEHQREEQNISQRKLPLGTAARPKGKKIRQSPYRDQSQFLEKIRQSGRE